MMHPQEAIILDKYQIFVRPKDIYDQQLENHPKDTILT